VNFGKQLVKYFNAAVPASSDCEYVAFCVNVSGVERILCVIDSPSKHLHYNLLILILTLVNHLVRVQSKHNEGLSDVHQ
jgi:hypothetical protein